MLKLSQIIHVAELLDGAGHHRASDACMRFAARKWESVFNPPDLPEELLPRDGVPKTSGEWEPTISDIVMGAQLLLKERPNLSAKEALHLAKKLLSPIEGSIFLDE